MQRHRCARCRNPIRTATAVTVPAGEDESWFHPDCWADFLSATQQEYQQKIQRVGLAALLAPYFAPEPVVASSIASLSALH